MTKQVINKILLFIFTTFSIQDHHSTLHFLIAYKKYAIRLIKQLPNCNLKICQKYPT